MSYFLFIFPFCQYRDLKKNKKHQQSGGEQENLEESNEGVQENVKVMLNHPIYFH